MYYVKDEEGKEHGFKTVAEVVEFALAHGKKEEIEEMVYTWLAERDAGDLAWCIVDEAFKDVTLADLAKDRILNELDWCEDEGSVGPFWWEE